MRLRVKFFILFSFDLPQDCTAKLFCCWMSPFFQVYCGDKSCPAWAKAMKVNLLLFVKCFVLPGAKVCEGGMDTDNGAVVALLSHLPHCKASLCIFTALPFTCTHCQSILKQW